MGIIQGYRIPFITSPPLKISQSPQFPVDSSVEMSQEISRMIAQGIIEPAPDQVGFESHLFLVEKQNGSFRPVLNLKGLNRYLGKEYFRLTSMHKVPSFLQPRDWMCKVDLHQAYFHVPVSESHRRFLRFAGIFQGQLRYWQMTCLPFGLASAPMVFASLSNWVAHQLRQEGIRLLVYLDDFLLVSQCPHTLQKHVQRAVNLLQQLGWVINMEKSSTVPSQSLEFLGIQWDTRLNQKSLPEKKLHALEFCLHQMHQTVIWSSLSLQRLVGRLNFSSFVVPFGRFNRRNILFLMQFAVRNGVSITPTKAALADLHWWRENFQHVSEIWLQPVSHFVVTDASNQGWGAYVDGVHVQGPWSLTQRSLPSNVKELLAVSFVLQEFARLFKNETVLVQSDNKTALAYLRNQGGTRSAVLMSLTRIIFNVLMTYRINLVTSYIPGPLNTIADSLSRFKRLPEWHLLPEACQVVFRKWGRPVIDLFASHSAHVVPCYVTRNLRDQKAVFYDAFSQRWSFRLAWVFPPPSLMLQVLNSLNSAKGRFVIICPKWTNVPWRSDLRARALQSPLVIPNLQKVLVDTSTGLPPPHLQSLILEAWLVQGGTSFSKAGPPR
ncbi:hypothetical protein O0L34_g6958 [Tuta absoluta]|nr:hypothetical protein O0L34_g6958 [Tuta absoluta]